jgi:NDP-sugar pyrophosphorylase family protein
MVPVQDEPFLEWLVRRLVVCGLRNMVLSTGYKAEIIAEWARERPPFSTEYLRCVEEKEPLGTGGAIAFALASITTPYVLILNGDTLLLEDVEETVERVAEENLAGAIFVREVDDASRYGTVEMAHGLVKGFKEKQPGEGWINGGMYVFRTEWLKENLPEGRASFEEDVLPRFLKSGVAIGAAPTKAPFIDIGTPETLAEANAFVTHYRGFFA